MANQPDPQAIAHAYRRGVEDVIALARLAAAAMPATGLHATRHGFASAALEALAEEARALVPPILEEEPHG